MAMPFNYYLDPAMGAAEIEKKNEWREKREKYGCKVCRHHGIAWGRVYCQSGCQPGPKGFCRAWTE